MNIATQQSVWHRDEHRAAKLEVYNALLSSPEVDWLMVERFRGEVRLDVSCRVRKKYLLTVELQYSDKSPEIIAERTRLYSAREIHVLWLLPYPEDLLEGEAYTMTLMERYMHVLYFGTVYYHHSADNVLPVHFRSYTLGSVYRTWYDHDKEQWQEGFIEQYPKNHSRIPESHPLIKITDLKPIYRQEGQFSLYSLPKAQLWGIDKPWFRSGEVE